MVEGVCMMGFLSSIFYLLAIGIAVFIHEMGHYLVARKFGVIAKEFSIGFGFKLFSFDKGGTQFSLRLIPMGGYCKFNDDPESLDMFPGLAHWKKLLILVSGVAMNALAIIILLFGLFWTQTADESFGSRVELASTGSVVVFGELVGSIADPSNYSDSGKEIAVETVEEKVTLSGVLLKFYATLIGINLVLFLFNILPIPVLDGGRMVLVGIEWARGKPLSDKVVTVYYAIGAILVLIIVIGSWFI
jgi:membrane-associated protease RseP (regulator of RpoE activity)